MARIIVVPDAEAMAEAAADRVVALLGGAIEVRGLAHVALTGGSTAIGLYRALLEPARRDAIDWSRVEFWWGDERYVPPDDPASNARLARDTLLGGGLPIAAERIHPFPVEAAMREGRGAAWAAATYGASLREQVPLGPDGLPIFDLVLLGMGGDGHVLSVFPDSPALDDDAPLVLDVPAPTHIEPHVPRVTLNPRLVTAARAVLVMCHGVAKAGRVAEVLEGPEDPRTLPAQLARGPNAVWLLDAAAASELVGG